MKLVAFAALAIGLLVGPAAWAQSVVSGEVDGTVTDPDSDIQDAGTRFWQSQSTVTPPNSPSGNFQGAAVSSRVLQLNMKCKF